VDEPTAPDAGRWFDAAWYLARNPDVVRAGFDPWSHYLRWGEPEGRKPSVWFDPAWYRVAHELTPGESPLCHFLARRAAGTHPPCPALFAAAHLPDGRAAVAAGADPYDRYLADHTRPDHELMPDLTVLSASGLIGAGYARHLPAAEAALDPVLHYCRIGWRVDRRPNDAFDPVWYKAAVPEVARLGINPLTHYTLVGEAAGVWPVPWFDPVWYRRTFAVPAGETALAHYARHRHDRLVSPNALFDVAWYTGRHEIPADIDPFSHFLVHGSVGDVDPSPRFASRRWRHQHMAPLTAPGLHALPLERRNPLVHHLMFMARLA
jgi:hypothetical protein